MLARWLFRRRTGVDDTVPSPGILGFGSHAATPSVIPNRNGFVSIGSLSIWSAKENNNSSLVDLKILRWGEGGSLREVAYGISQKGSLALMCKGYWRDTKR